jgi:hypothetical protein
MPGSPLETVYDRWTHPSWEVRVRNPSWVPVTPAAANSMYLWGSADTAPVTFTTKPPVLHLRNDEFGSPITLSTQAGGTSTTVGTLQPGQCFSLELQNISAVVAMCQTESVVACLIHT